MLLVQKAERVFLTDETIFYLNPPINNQNNHIWSADTKHDAELVQCAKLRYCIGMDLLLLQRKAIRSCGQQMLT